MPRTTNSMRVSLKTQEKIIAKLEKANKRRAKKGKVPLTKGDLVSMAEPKIAVNDLVGAP